MTSSLEIVTLTMVVMLVEISNSVDLSSGHIRQLGNFSTLPCSATVKECPKTAQIEPGTPAFSDTEVLKEQGPTPGDARLSSVLVSSVQDQSLYLTTSAAPADLTTNSGPDQNKMEGENINFLGQYLGDRSSQKIFNSPIIQELMAIIQDEARHVDLPSGSRTSLYELAQAFMRLRWDKVLKRVVAQQRVDVTFPRPDDVSIPCYENLMDVIEGMIGVADASGSLVTKEWVLQMLDAFGKPSAGLLKGVFQWVGNYEECLEVQAQSGDVRNQSTGFSGKYCRVLIPVGHIISMAFPEDINKFWTHQQTFPVTVNWGVCVPETCSSGDILSFLKNGTLASLNLLIERVVCFEGSKFSEDVGAIITVVFLCISAALVIICTLLDIYYYRPWLTSNNQSSSFSDEDKETGGNMMELGNGSGGTRNEGSVSIWHSQSHGAAVSASRAQNEVELTSPQQTMFGQTACVNKNTYSVVIDEMKGRALSGQKSVHAKAEQEVNSNSVAEGITANQDKMNQGATTLTSREREKTVKSQRKFIGEQLIQGVSAYRNMRVLLSKTRFQGTFDCIQGIRVISLAWVVVGHSYTFGGMLDQNNLIFKNAAELVETSARLSFHIVGSAHLAVDTFFVISGCLSMLVTLRLLRRNKPGVKFWLAFLFHRFWRLTPMYMVVMMVGVNLYDHVVQGPLKTDKLVEFEECRHKWWSHLLYINNFYKPYSKCMTWSWFMAVDMQLFVVSPVFIYVVYRNLKIGIGLILCFSLCGMASAFVSEFIHGGQFVLMDLSFIEYWSHVYTMPWARVSVFGIGFLLGVVLYKYSGRPLISKRKALCVWLVVIGVSVFLVLINHNQWKHGSQNWTRLQQSFYESLVRPGWALCVAWAIYACCTDLGGYANTILGWRPFLVLSRLTYSLYLLHPLVILFVVYSRRTTIYLHPAHLSLVYNYIGNLTVTFLLSAVFSLTFEMPMTALEGILWRVH